MANRGTKNKLAPPVPLVKNFTSCLGDGWRVVCARKKLRIGGDTIHDRNITIHVGGNSFPIWGRTLFVSGKNLLSLKKSAVVICGILWLGTRCEVFEAKHFYPETEHRSPGASGRGFRQNPIDPGQ